MFVRSLLIAFLVFFGSHISFAQPDSTATPKGKLIIGIAETPPFVEKQPYGYSGLSISSWKLVNEQLQAEYEFREYDDLNSLLAGIEKGEVDMSVNPITVTEQRMKRMDFSQPYFISHTSLVQRRESTLLRHIKNFFSWDFFKVVFLLLLVIFIFGFLAWLFERKKNREEFGEGFRGIMQGFWWSAVTMTTVGYGDKSPRTTGGRIIGLIWMFLAVIIISSFTAGIASSLTVKSINEEIGAVQDLQRFDVTTVNSSSSQELLELYNIESKLFNNEMEAIQALLNEEVNIFVYDEPILKYLIQQQNLEDELEILSQSLKKDYYSYSFPKDSPLLKKINPVLIRSLKSMEWSALVEDYK
ncbi:transporter substrate-binding domain-containing protein [Gramella sp. GC03-9]|uniref:Transporter substrate-binding domain-containing protein n=1 Tax=Christiangramia oceanisediminis TaxID=2920386 RepID=A0A9X2RBC5_9FLAO|nr:transporter substrate-binding domain-containing protein [Gramella oceanisediminis]MCP9200380.1 transporter substrate-binding domain-containing protein [Gramella oceanisediminis]